VVGCERVDKFVVETDKRRLLTTQMVIITPVLMTVKLRDV